ncbi:TIGR04282 family arsenosugar biosynthesis glycosyltransferase [Shimia abyssi]|nr:TIGR04282 family arsenosugar biosynthesis glycosyltransferase [Shimia abyssi]
MVKEPRPGRVKTRLGRDIGMVPAARWFRHQTQALLRRMRDPRWDIVLAVAQDRDGMISRVWPKDLAKRPQGRGDLGDRMRRMLRQSPPGPVCVIGADIPGIERHHIAEAFAALGDHDTVFGPAPDGGYWLVGLKRTASVPPTLFEGVRWSSEHALADSKATVPGHRIAQVATLQDVDTVADLP